MTAALEFEAEEDSGRKSRTDDEVHMGSRDAQWESGFRFNQHVVLVIRGSCFRLFALSIMAAGLQRDRTADSRILSTKGADRAIDNMEGSDRLLTRDKML